MKEKKDNGEDETKKDYSGLIDQVRRYLMEYYEPVQQVMDADFHYTTEEVYRQLQRIVCDPVLFSASDVALWLHEGGFVYKDFGQLRLEWLMKKKK